MKRPKAFSDMISCVSGTDEELVNPRSHMLLLEGNDKHQIPLSLPPIHKRIVQLIPANSTDRKLALRGFEPISQRHELH